MPKIFISYSLYLKYNYVTLTLYSFMLVCAIMKYSSKHKHGRHYIHPRQLWSDTLVEVHKDIVLYGIDSKLQRN